MNQLPEQADQPPQAPETIADDSTARPSTKRAWLIGLVILFVLLALLAAAAYQGWRLWQQDRQRMSDRFEQLQSQIDSRPTSSQINSHISELANGVRQSNGQMAALKKQQQTLQESTEKLYDLYGRDENGWKLAEVEYLLSIAQHKLVLENDFEGAAKTLGAASDLIAELADPGLLPVRVLISDEIARLKTRRRPDLVGMTLLLGRLSRQIGSLQPGYQNRVETATGKTTKTIEAPASSRQELPLQQRALAFIKSLVTVKTRQPSTTTDKTEHTAIIDVTEKLQDNLKLTRWSLLERDAFQFNLLMQENVDLFQRYYDLDNAANADFFASLQQLQQTPIKPDLPDISGSLRLLKQIEKQREESPDRQETDNG